MPLLVFVPRFLTTPALKVSPILHQGALLQGLLHKFSVSILGTDNRLVEKYVLQTQVQLHKTQNLKMWVCMNCCCGR